MNSKVALVIDDNRTNIQVIETLLETQHVRTIAITNPQKVATLISDIETPDIVFLDLEMPGLNGYDILKLLKENQRMIDVPVVAYSVHTGQFTDARAAGFHSFIPKPLDFKRFPGQLARILSGERVWEPH